MKEHEFYICKHCGNIVAKVIDRGPKISCCGEEMIVLRQIPLMLPRKSTFLL
jgi:superoxide reductase